MILVEGLGKVSRSGARIGSKGADSYSKHLLWRHFIEIQPRLGRSSVSRNSNQNRDRGATTSHHTTSRILRAEHSRPEATSYHQQVANLLRDQMSDSDRTDSTGDRNAFGFQTALVQTVPAKAHHHAEKYDVVGPVGSDGEEGESDGEVVEQALKEYGQAREEIKLDVKEMFVSFRST
jgi:hypothetical protein